MRISVTVAGLFAGLMLGVVLYTRWGRIAASGSDVPILNIGLWMLLVWFAATAAAYSYPWVAVGLFAVTGSLGLLGGLANSASLLLIWGGIASVLVLLSFLATREQAAAEQRSLVRDHQFEALLATVHNVERDLQVLRGAPGPGDEAPPDRSD